MWRRLYAGRQALPVPVYLREGETFEQAGAGFGVSAATAWRYVEEAVMLLSARSPKLGGPPTTCGDRLRSRQDE
ncbi:helix-turn-helix domain-containing protein [Sphaerisporangium dianthi]|uniref:Transposase family protein n=1 Tax=Sphaerisporangium dianthi TaxID=1436120 RepID=A0ABV9CN43_9ACTN